MLICKDLPIEILENIFQRLEKEDNSQCSLTCRAWNAAAQPILFESIRWLTDSKLGNLSAILSCSSLRQSPTEFVKNLQVSILSDSSNVALINELFPFLEIIDINPDPQVHDKLYQLILEGQFPHLKKMPFIKLDKAHLKLLMARKEHIKYLDLRDELHGENAMNQLSKHIHLFSKLKEVKLRLSHDETHLCLETMFPKNLSALKTIDFTFVSHAKLILNMPVDLNTVQPLPSVQDVMLGNHHLFYYGGESYLYFMKKFPNVQVLFLNSRIQAPVYQIPTVACLSAFLVYLFNIKKMCTVQSIITNHITASVVEHFLNQALGQNSGTKVKLHIGFDEERQGLDLDCTAQIDAIKKYCDRKKLFELKVIYRFTLENFICPPFLELFQKVGFMDIEKLTIGDNYWMRHTPNRLHIPLDITLDYFTNLKRLCIHGISSITFSDLEIISESALEYLSFHICNLNLELFTKISRKCLNLKVLKIDDLCSFTNHNEEHDAEDTLRIISINMPYTHLNDLHFSVSLEANEYRYDDYERAFIRLRTSNKKTRYCSLLLELEYWGTEPDYSTEFDANESGYTEDDFETYMNDDSCIVYDIFCGAVEKFIVYAGTGHTYQDRLKRKELLEEDL